MKLCTYLCIVARRYLLLTFKLNNMRQITRDAVNAFMNNEPFSRSNTTVNVYKTVSRTDTGEVYKTDGVTVLYLHGNRIASKCHDTGKIRISDAGWPTATTKERLNGIPNVSIRQKRGYGI